MLPANPPPKSTSPPPNILNDLEDANLKVDEKLPDVKDVESDNGSKDNCEDQVEDSDIFTEQVSFSFMRFFVLFVYWIGSWNFYLNFNFILII